MAMTTARTSESDIDIQEKVHGGGKMTDHEVVQVWLPKWENLVFGQARWGFLYSCGYESYIKSASICRNSSLIALLLEEKAQISAHYLLLPFPKVSTTLRSSGIQLYCFIWSNPIEMKLKQNYDTVTPMTSHYTDGISKTRWGGGWGRRRTRVGRPL